MSASDEEPGWPWCAMVAPMSTPTSSPVLVPLADLHAMRSHLAAALERVNAAIKLAEDPTPPPPPPPPPEETPTAPEG